MDLWMDIPGAILVAIGALCAICVAIEDAG